jgi:hypothetical protein
MHLGGAGQELLQQRCYGYPTSLHADATPQPEMSASVSAPDWPRNGATFMVRVFQLRQGKGLHL